jgi:hypothetical protein
LNILVWAVFLIVDYDVEGALIYVCLSWPGSKEERSDEREVKKWCGKESRVMRMK